MPITVLNNGVFNVASATPAGLPAASGAVTPAGASLTALAGLATATGNGEPVTDVGVPVLVTAGLAVASVKASVNQGPVSASLASPSGDVLAANVSPHQAMAGLATASAAAILPVVT